jgi:hypothetical protein
MSAVAYWRWDSRCTQNGDAEGSLLFDSHNPATVEAAMQFMRARRKRKVTPKLIAHLGEIGKLRRFEGHGDKGALPKCQIDRNPAGV